MNDREHHDLCRAFDNYRAPVLIRCEAAGSVFVEVTGVSEISLNVRDTDSSSSLAYIGGVDVSFQKVHPNGPDCPPTCDVAERTVTMVPTEASGD